MNIIPTGAEMFHAEGQKNRWTDGQTERHDKAK